MSCYCKAYYDHRSPALASAVSSSTRTAKASDDDDKEKEEELVCIVPVGSPGLASKDEDPVGRRTWTNADRHTGIDGIDSVY